MGKLLSLLRPCPSPKDNDIFVDFENAQPTPQEESVYRTVEVVLAQSKEILKDMQSYKGAMAEIRQAINNPQDEQAQTVAWDSIVKLVGHLKAYYDFSKELENVVTSLLTELCSDNMSSIEHLEQQQALFRQFAEVLDFTLSFDEAKMTTPSVQNDLSYYRRKASHMKTGQNGTPSHESFELSSDLQGRMSLFFAESRPMMKCVSDTACRFVADHKEIPLENTAETLAKMATICRVMVTTNEYRERISNETFMFILRVMVGVLILYDHVHPMGAFVKNLHIDMEKYVRVLRQHAFSTNLLDALKYTSKHYSDITTPDSVKRAFL